MLTNPFNGAIILFKKSYDEEGRVAKLSERRRLVQAVSGTIQLLSLPSRGSENRLVSRQLPYSLR